MLYLADTTIWSWARRSPPLADALAQRVQDNLVATCVPIALELLHSSRSELEYERDLRRVLEPLIWLPLDQAASEQALVLQRDLARASHGAHRLPSMDYLIAGCAIAAGDHVVVWHADRDLARLCTRAGQPHEHERISR